MQAGDIIKSLRVSSGMSQEEFGKQYGISRLVIGRYERGQIAPPADTLLTMISAQVPHFIRDLSYALSPPEFVEITIEVMPLLSRGYDEKA